jgi:hypothetical protein
MASQPAFHEDIGRGLFRSLLPGRLGELYRAAFAQSAVVGQTLTLELCFDAETMRIARYPWELLHDSTRFLLQSGVTITRRLPFPDVSYPVNLHPPLDVLFVSAHPKDHAPLDSAYDLMERAVGQSNNLDLAYLMPSTWDTLMDWTLAGAPGILHFEGHGDLTRVGQFFFEDERGGPDQVDAPTLAAAFYSTSLQAVMLAATEDLSSAAPSLILEGFPAVIAMQQPIPPEAMARFARGFYGALLTGQDLDVAVTAGRKQLDRSVYWHVPALYRRQDWIPDPQPVICRIDTAAPSSVPESMPVRLGVWFRTPDAPVPSDLTLRRLIGVERSDDHPLPDPQPVEAETLRAGPVEIRLVVPNGEIHTGAVKHTVLAPDFDPPPVWFCFTPNESGPITLEIVQGDQVIASLVHPISVSGEEPGPLSLLSHSLGSPAFEGGVDQSAEAASLNKLSEQRRAEGKRQEAYELATRALEIYRSIGDRQGEAATLNNLGYIFFFENKPDRAAGVLAQALQIYRDLNAVPEAAAIMFNLAVVMFQKLNRQREALELVTRSVALLERNRLPADASGQTVDYHRAFLEELKRRMG